MPLELDIQIGTGKDMLEQQQENMTVFVINRFESKSKFHFPCFM